MIVLTLKDGRKREFFNIRQARPFPLGSRLSCDNCQIVWINGVPCHETGCPCSWKDEHRECKFCGQKFYPEWSGQKCCSTDCQDSYQ